MTKHSGHPAALIATRMLSGQRATEAIQKYGTMVKSPSGYPIQSPNLAIANRQAELMMRISAECGFTPASRCWIATPQPEEPTLFG